MRNGCSEDHDLCKERYSEYEGFDDQHLEKVMWTGSGLKTSLTILLLLIWFYTRGWSDLYPILFHLLFRHPSDYLPTLESCQNASFTTPSLSHHDLLKPLGTSGLAHRIREPSAPGDRYIHARLCQKYKMQSYQLEKKRSPRLLQMDGTPIQPRYLENWMRKCSDKPWTWASLMRWSSAGQLLSSDDTADVSGKEGNLSHRDFEEMMVLLISNWIIYTCFPFRNISIASNTYNFGS